jgi:hypothetical protein
MEINPDPGYTSRIMFLEIWYKFFRLKILKFFVNSVLRIRIRAFLTPGSGTETSGSGINIPDPQNCKICTVFLKQGCTHQVSAYLYFLNSLSTHSKVYLFTKTEKIEVQKR